MAGRRRAWYPPEYKERSSSWQGGWSVSLVQEVEPSEETVRNWFKQLNLHEGLWCDGLTTLACKRMQRLKRDIK